MNDLALAWRRDLFAVARCFSPRPPNMCATTTQTAAKAPMKGMHTQLHLERCTQPKAIGCSAVLQPASAQHVRYHDANCG
jgi:hypothetical protein